MIIKNSLFFFMKQKHTQGGLKNGNEVNDMKANSDEHAALLERPRFTEIVDCVAIELFEIRPSVQV